MIAGDTALPRDLGPGGQAGPPQPAGGLWTLSVVGLGLCTAGAGPQAGAPWVRLPAPIPAKVLSRVGQSAQQ